MKKKIKIAEIPIFIIFTFLIPLVCIALMKYSSMCSNGVFQMILYGIEGASPAISAILTVFCCGGISNVKRFLRNKYWNCFSLKICLFGLFLPGILLTVAKLITYMTPYHNQFITMPNSKKIIILLWALIAEELGWRGFLQERVEKKCGDILTPFVVGLIWAAWHYHFFISGTMDVPIVAFVYGCIAESYGYYFITKWSKGNIVPASLWHFSGNVFFNLFLFDCKWNGGSMIPYLITNAIFSVYVIAFVFYKKKIKIKLALTSC